MKQVLAAILAVFIAGAAWAQDVLAPNPDIEATIQGQFDAFLADDVETAFTYASPTIQGMFGTPERFGAMVRQGYPMVWRPADVQFGDLLPAGGYVNQRVSVTDAGGRVHLLEYRMVERAGTWLIAGVRILEVEALSA